MDFSIWLAFVLASTFLVIIPGPTVLFMLSYALLANGFRNKISHQRPCHGCPELAAVFWWQWAS